MYKTIIKPIAFLFDPEKVHDFFTLFGRLLGSFWIGRRLVSLIYGYRGNRLEKTVNGLKFRTPFLLSAGFDYNGHLSKILPNIGLGGEEVGSITARPCEGNKKPRLTRLVKSKSILVNKGLRNDGVDEVIKRLKGKSKNDNFVIGVSIARTNDDKSVSIEKGIEDYVYSFKRLNEENVGDYYTLNISCPNAFGGETFAQKDFLSRLLTSIKKIPSKRPLFVKMPINLEWTIFSELLNVLDINNVDGVVIGNLNKDYSDLDYRNEAPTDYRGGLSGKPCQKLSTDLIRETRQKYGNRFTIIGVGGVMSPKDAFDKLDAGADLIQMITGIIFEGPGLVRRLCKSLEKRLL